MIGRGGSFYSLFRKQISWGPIKLFGGGGGGGEIFFFSTNIFFEKCSWDPETQNKQNIWRGICWGVWGRPALPLGVALGRKIHFFLLTMTSKYFGMIRFGVQNLSSGRKPWRRKKKTKKITTDSP